MNWVEAISWFAFVCAFLLLVISYTPVENGERGDVKRFGKLIRVLPPGFNFVVPFLDKVKINSTKTIQREFPGNPEQVEGHDARRRADQLKPFRIYHKGMKEARFYVKKTGRGVRNDPKDPLAAYKLVTFSELGRKVKAGMKDDAAHASLTSEIPVVVEWNPPTELGDVINYYENVDDKDMPREDEVNRRLNDQAAKVLQELLGPVTAGHALEMMPVFNAVIKLRMEAVVGETVDPRLGPTDRPWGVHISEAFFKEAELGETINRARAEAAAAVNRRRETILDSEAEAKATINQANADAHRIRVTKAAEADGIKDVGEAEKAREIAEGQGKAGHIAAVASEIVKPGGLEAARLNVAESALTAEGRTVYLPTNVAAMAGVLTAVQEMAAVPTSPAPPVPPAQPSA